MSSLSSTNTTGSQATRDGVKPHLTCKLVFGPDKGIPKSPLQHLLKSNEPPSESEINVIRALITRVQVQIQELHRRFPTSTPARQATESWMVKFIEAHKALLSPVRHIPTEILQEIFLHYADSRIQESSGSVAMMPWHLGQICHRWREIALSFPCLWDQIPTIQIGDSSLAKQSSVRAFTCLMQRSGASPTLKFRINCFPLNSKFELTGYPIIKRIVFHSERIQKLHIVQLELESENIITSALQGLKGRLPNLRVLRLYFRRTYSNRELVLDMFETAPALWKVTLDGSHRGNGVRILLPWPQITHFEDRLQIQGARRQNVPFSLLRSVIYLDIDKARSDGSIPLTPHQPTTLPHLRILKAILYCLTLGIILDCLTIPAVEIIKIRYPGSLIPRLISMFSRSHEPSRLQKLSYRTTSLEAGQLTSLLKLTPQLIELDISIPPTYDVLQLSCREGKDRLVPMLEALYMRGWEKLGGTETAGINNLAHVRCESSDKDPEDTIGSSLPNTLHMLRILFNSVENRDNAQKLLHGWSPQTLFDPEEAEAVHMLSRWNGHSHHDPVDASIPDGRNDNLSLNELLVFIDRCGAITHKVLCETSIHIELRRVIGLMTPDQNEMKQRAMNTLAKWDRLLLNNLPDYRWSRPSPELYNCSLVYVPRSKHFALRTSPDALSIVYGLKLEGRFEETLWDRI